MTDELLANIDFTYTQNLLKQMIRIDSIVGNEENLAEFLRAELAKLGLKCQIDYVEPNRPNIYTKIDGTKSGKRLNFNGHLDTIPVVDGWITDPFDPVVKDGKMFGLGSCDMKAGIACILTMLRAFVNSNQKFSGELSFSGVIDEEAYGKGAKAMLKSEYGSVDAIVLAEPYPGDESKPIPLGLTGKVLYDITVRGKAAHAFRPHLGINAIEEMGKILGALDKLITVEHPEYGKGNYSTLKIEGGYDIYSVVVPYYARMEVNRLLLPDETIQSALDSMQSLIASLNLDAEVEVHLKPPQYESYVIDKEEPIMKVFDAVYKSIMKKSAKYKFTRGITDANIFAGEGKIPCLHLGPQQETAHQKNEFVLLDWLTPLSKMYSLIAYNFLGEG